MLKHILAVSVLVVATVSPLWASNRDENDARIRKATQVFQEITSTPDKGIPEGIMTSAKCIAIIPGEKKLAFMFGGEYGKGLATCRNAQGWSAPVFLAVGGGSFGFQIGGSSTDLVLIFMNDHALQSLLSDKFKIGADAIVAAGPVGRHITAGTDIKLNAEILAYSRSKGVFAGISLDGAVVQTDQSGNYAEYGADVNRSKILSGEIPVPQSAHELLEQIAECVAPHTPGTKLE